jgi:hypothetical protein
MALASARAEWPATAARGWRSRRPWRSMYVGGLPHEISCRRQAGGELLLWERAHGRVAPPSRAATRIRGPLLHIVTLVELGGGEWRPVRWRTTAARAWRRPSHACIPRARSGRLARQCGPGGLVRTCTATASSARQFSARTGGCVGRGGAQAGGSAGRGGAQAGGRGRCGAGGYAAHDLRRRGAAAAAPCRPATTAGLFLRRFRTRARTDLRRPQ